MSKRAIITGITGQDGSYLAELLLGKGYEVFGVVRRLSAPNVWRIEHLLGKITLLQADLLDQLSLIKAVDAVRPHEFYNLAAMSFVPASWDQPMLTGEFNSQGVTRCLEAIRQVDTSIRFYQASSSEMFGKVREVPQNEDTPFYPRSPYGVSKVFGHYITVNYRESYGLFACSGILFNHESPRRGLEFVTRKVTDGVARIKLGLADTLSLGNLDGEARLGLCRRLRARDVADAAAGRAGRLRRRDGRDPLGAGARGARLRRTSASTGAAHVRQDPAFLRPAEVDLLIGDASEGAAGAAVGARGRLQRASSRMMVDADLERLTAAREHARALSAR